MIYAWGEFVTEKEYTRTSGNTGHIVLLELEGVQVFGLWKFINHVTYMHVLI